MIGKVTKYFKDKGYGFIRGEDNQQYFVHTSKLNGEYIERGYLVFFNVFANDRADNNAKDITVIEAAERNNRYGKKSLYH